MADYDWGGADACCPRVAVLKVISGCTTLICISKHVAKQTVIPSRPFTLF